LITRRNLSEDCQDRRLTIDPFRKSFRGEAASATMAKSVPVDSSDDDDAPESFTMASSREAVLRESEAVSQTLSNKKKKTRGGRRTKGAVENPAPDSDAAEIEELPADILAAAAEQVAALEEAEDAQQAEEMARMERQEAQKLRHKRFSDIEKNKSSNRKRKDNFKLKVLDQSGGIGDLLKPSSDALAFAERLASGANGNQVCAMSRCCDATPNMTPLSRSLCLLSLRIKQKRMRRSLFVSQKSNGPSKQFKR